VGIAGLTAKKWTECTEVDITDYHPSVIDNARQNMHRNKLLCPIYELNWTKREAAPTQYHIIMGSDVVYFGCPVADLYQVFKERLITGGIGIIVIPVRKNYAQLFASQIEEAIFDLEIEKLSKEQYFENPL
jgi:predicted nicotinamide N-methyase